MKRVFLLAAVALASICGAQAQETEVNQYGQEVKSLPVEATIQDGILVFQNKEANYKMWFDVRIQADAAAFFGYDKDEYSIGNGMSLRRTRFAVKAQLDKNWYGEIDTDWTSGMPEIKDAYLKFSGVEDLEVKVGNFKENFSIQRNTTSRYLQFMERPMITSLAPSRHLGINFTYSKPLYWVSAGISGPELKTFEEQTAFEDANKDWQRSEGLAYTAKAVLRPLHNMEDGSLHIGFAYSYRNPKLTAYEFDTYEDAEGEEVDIAYPVARFDSRNSTNINRVKYLDSKKLQGVDHEDMYTIELAGHYKALRYEAAYISKTAYLKKAIAAEIADPEFWDGKLFKKMKEVPESVDLTGSGWYVQAGYLLFGGNQNYDEGGAKYTRVNRGKDWGDLELCLRYEECDFNFNDVQIADKYRGGFARAYAVGLNYYPSQNVKLILNYQYNDNDKFADAGGDIDVPDAGLDYSMIAMRFEVAF